MWRSISTTATKSSFNGVNGTRPRARRDPAHIRLLLFCGHDASHGDRCDGDENVIGDFRCQRQSGVPGIAMLSPLFAIHIVPPLTLGPVNDT